MLPKILYKLAVVHVHVLIKTLTKQKTAKHFIKKNVNILKFNSIPRLKLQITFQ